MFSYLPYDIGVAIKVARDSMYFPIPNEELFGTPESSKSQGSYAAHNFVSIH